MDCWEYSNLDIGVHSSKTKQTNFHGIPVTPGHVFPQPAESCDMIVTKNAELSSQQCKAEEGRKGGRGRSRLCARTSLYVDTQRVCLGTIHSSLLWGCNDLWCFCWVTSESPLPPWSVKSLSPVNSLRVTKARERPVAYSSVSSSVAILSSWKCHSGSLLIVDMREWWSSTLKTTGPSHELHCKNNNDRCNLVYSF